MTDTYWETWVTTAGALFEAVRKQAREFAEISGTESRVLSRGGEWEVRIDPDHDTLVIAVEYNDACNCHPEYQTEKLDVPWDTARRMLEGGDWRSPMQRLAAERRERERRAEAERVQREQERAKRIERERELAELKRLREKYPDGGCA